MIVFISSFFDVERVQAAETFSCSKKKGDLILTKNMQCTSYSIADDVTIDLNDYTLEFTQASIVSFGNLTINDSKGTGKIIKRKCGDPNLDDKAVIRMYNRSLLTINGGSFYNYSGLGSIIQSDYSDVVINGGKFEFRYSDINYSESEQNLQRNPIIAMNGIKCYNRDDLFATTRLNGGIFISENPGIIGTSYFCANTETYDDIIANITIPDDSNFEYDSSKFFKNVSGDDEVEQIKITYTNIISSNASETIKDLTSTKLYG